MLFFVVFLLHYQEGFFQSGTDLALVNYNSFTTESLSDPIVELNRDDEIRADDIGRSLLSRLRERHQRHLDDVERLNEEFKETARTRCSSLVKELFTPSTFLSESVEEREDSDEDPKQCKTDEFLKTIGMSEESLGDKMHDLFSKMFTSSSSMGSDIQKRKKIIASVLGTGREAFEWRVSEGTILSDISHVVVSSHPYDVVTQ
ncbi:hypothetical protein KIN20_037558 [Parelaphostrongylus tenuis]|uniref:Uncharacterized protein n=1 Tax=Parelaphostrongylus tenuis TaxID=148309 RepID=A0AAD5REX1_PARTN|nr:hypothetical protein KIN20_037558 [Parelaphostrongylus tenuis]